VDRQNENPLARLAFLIQYKNSLYCGRIGQPGSLHFAGGADANRQHAATILEGQQAGAVLADKGYDANYIVAAVNVPRANVVMPPPSPKNSQRDFDFILWQE